MASYYDEHNCEPDDGETGSRQAHSSQTDDLLQLVRSLLAGDMSAWFSELTSVMGATEDGLAPPASRDVVEKLKRREIYEEESDDELKCPVCLLVFNKVEIVVELPCEHAFHSQCILPWLEKTNSCPNCRKELPTDDPAYERRKIEREEETARELRVQEYHDSMFG